MNPQKPVEVPGQTPTRDPRRQIPHEQIAQRAEKIWRDRNCPTGRDEEIWLQAESELQAEAEARPVAGTASRPYVDEPAKQLRTRTKTQDPADAAVQTRSATEGRSGRAKIRAQ